MNDFSARVLVNGTYRGQIVRQFVSKGKTMLVLRLETSAGHPTNNTMVFEQGKCSIVGYGIGPKR
jgi:hypothetical protein